MQNIEQAPISIGMKSTWSDEISLNLSRVKIMVVEESSGMRRLLVSVFRAFGIDQVTSFEDRERALSGLSSFSPDIITMDFMMSEVNGVEFTYDIRKGKTPLDIYVPIIMISGSSSVGEIEFARDSGVTEFLVKPVSPKMIYLRLLSVIQNPRPFINTKNFFGPDRRRRSLDSYGGKERRRKPHDYSKCQQRVLPR